MAREQPLDLGQEAVAYSPKTNMCLRGKVVGKEMVETSRARYMKYQLQLDDEQMAQFPFYRVFTKQDWDGEKLDIQQSIAFGVDAKFYGIDPQVAIQLIIEALTVKG